MADQKTAPEQAYSQFENKESRLLDHWYAPVVAKKAFDAGYEAGRSSSLGERSTETAPPDFADIAVGIISRGLSTPKLVQESLAEELEKLYKKWRSSSLSSKEATGGAK